MGAITLESSGDRPLLFARIACAVVDAMVLLLVPCALLIVGTGTAIASDGIQFAAVLMAIGAVGLVVGLLVRAGFLLLVSPIVRLLSATPSIPVLYALACAFATGCIQSLPMMGFVVSFQTDSIVPFIGALAVWLPAALWTWPRHSVANRWSSRQSSFARST